MTPTLLKELIQTHNGLTNLEKYTLEFLAVLDDPLPKNELLRELVAVIPNVTEFEGLRQKDFVPILKKLKAHGCISIRYDGISVCDEIYEQALVDALRSGRGSEYLQLLRDNPYRQSHWYGYGERKKRLLNRKFRESIFLGKVLDTFEIGAQLSKYIDPDREQPEIPLARMLSYRADLSFLQEGPVSLLLAYLPEALSEIQFFHSTMQSVLPSLVQFVSRVESIDDDDAEASFQQLLLLMVGECWLCGEADLAKSILDRMFGYRRQAAEAVAAFSNGDTEGAIALFETALADMRKTERRKRLFFNNVIGEIFLYACLQDDSAHSLFLAGELLEDISKPTNKSLYQDLFKKIAWLVGARLSPDSVSLWDYGVPWRGRTRVSEGTTDVLAKTLYSAEAVRQFDAAAAYIKSCVEAYQGTPHTQFIADLWALYNRLQDQDINTMADLPTPTFDFSQGDSDWKLVLYNISRIGQKAQPATSKKAEALSQRLCFRISMNDWSDYCEVKAYLQKQSRSGGWTKGKLFNLKKAESAGIDLSFLSKADHRALMLIEAEKSRRENRHYWQEINFNDALHTLVGHPYLFWETQSPIPMEIEAGNPQVEVVEKGDRVKIRMLPAEPCDKGYAVEKRNPNLLRVTRFTPLQLELLSALGESGSSFPKKAIKEIGTAVSHIATLAEVHSHVPKIGKSSMEVDADTTLSIRMQPFMSGLSAQFLVMPLGESGPSFVPGRGSVHVFAKVGDEKRSCTRDLTGESKRFDTLLLALGLQYADESGEGLYHFSDELLAIEFLSELEDYKQHADALPISIEWPKGVKLSCSRTLFPKDFRLLIQKKRQWLALSGEVAVSGKELVDVAVLVAGLGDSHKGYIKLKDGQFLRLSKSLRRFLLRLRGMGEEKEGGVWAPERAAISVQKLAREAGTVKGNAAWDRAVADLDRSLNVVSKVPSQVKATLRDYQQEGYRWLHRLSTLGLGACLADDMGLGKTLQTLTLMCERLGRKGQQKPALVVAPVSVIPGWFNEARRFVPSLDLVHYVGSGRRQILDSLKARQVLVTSYGLLQRDGAKLAKIDFDMIVLDEAQFIKNRESARAKAAFKLKGDFKMVTTGTPVENRLGEFWSIFHFINPGLLGTSKAFINVYEKNIQLFDDTQILESLRFLVKPFLLRRTKEETLDELPPKTEIVRYCEMEKEEAAYYELRRRQAVNVLKQSDSKQQMMELITALTTLRQVACHPRLVAPELTMESTKMNGLMDILTELLEGGHQALVFSQFVKFLTLVRERLDREGISYQYMDGSSSATKRTAAVDAFQAGESNLFLISMRAGGFGLNLTAADYVVHLDPWWNPAVEDQASDRVHRIGQSRPVTVYKLVTQGTVEEKVLQMHNDKRALAGELLEGSSAVAKMDMKELLALI